MELKGLVYCSQHRDVLDFTNRSFSCVAALLRVSPSRHSLVAQLTLLYILPMGLPWGLLSLFTVLVTYLLARAFEELVLQWNTLV